MIVEVDLWRVAEIWLLLGFISFLIDMSDHYSSRIKILHREGIRVAGIQENAVQLYGYRIMEKHGWIMVLIFLVVNTINGPISFKESVCNFLRHEKLIQGFPEVIGCQDCGKFFEKPEREEAHRHKCAADKVSA